MQCPKCGRYLVKVSKYLFNACPACEDRKHKPDPCSGAARTARASCSPAAPADGSLGTLPHSSPPFSGSGDDFIEKFSGDLHYCKCGKAHYLKAEADKCQHGV